MPVNTDGLAIFSSSSAKYLQDMERGEANPTLAMLVVIAQALDLSLGQLLDGI